MWVASTFHKYYILILQIPEEIWRPVIAVSVLIRNLSFAIEFEICGKLLIGKTLCAWMRLVWFQKQDNWLVKSAMFLTPFESFWALLNLCPYIDNKYCEMPKRPHFWILYFSNSRKTSQSLYITFDDGGLWVSTPSLRMILDKHWSTEF